MDLSTKESIGVLLSVIVVVIVLASVLSYPLFDKIIAIVESWC